VARILVIIFVLLANKVVAGYHVAFDKGFAEFAQQQGFNDFNDFLLKRKICGSLILNSNKNLNNKENDNRVGLFVDPPSGYHWMDNNGIFTLMKNPTSGYVKHPNSSITIKVPLYPNFLPEAQKSVQNTGDILEKTLEVDPPIGHHWMSNGKSYSLMKNPISGYGPHPGSSLKAKFSIFSRASVNVNAVDTELVSEKDITNKVSNLLFELLLNKNTKSLSDLFVKIDKDQWNANNCKLAMFIETNILTNILEATLTGAKTTGSKIKKPKPKNNYGYGY
jgi:hypothetical protein